MRQTYLIKKQPLLYALLFLFLGFPAISFSQYQLTVEVHQVVPNKGRLVIGLYHNAKDFLKDNRRYRTAEIKVKNVKMIRYTFKNIPKGSYAVTVYQDLNDDHKLNRNFFVFPAEPTGLSNNYRPTFGPPTFDKCRFFVKGNKEISIKLE